MSRFFILSLVFALFFSGRVRAQGNPDIPAHILAAAEDALAHRGEISAWSHALLTNIKTTALGCRLIPGLPLPTVIEAHRLEAVINGAIVPAHVSADGGMTQLCDETVTELGLGSLPRAYDPAGDDDGDAIINSADICPRIAGASGGERMGCPSPADGDRDGDGALDSIDICPDQAGASATDGCALLRDGDGDGVPDDDDVCAHEQGVIRADFALGCPGDGSGSSARQRGNHDACHVTGVHKAIHENKSESSYIIGVVDESGGDIVIGRASAGDWFQLERGWVTSRGLLLHGACYNIPLAHATLSAGTGCFLRPKSELVNVREAPRGKQVTQISSQSGFPALGLNFAGDWIFFRLGWASRSALTLAGTCDDLPVLNPARVASGVVHFCPPAYAGFLKPRINVGESNARVASRTFANRLRAAPQITAELIGEIQPRSTLDAVLDGPACDGSFVWWQVSVNGTVGWTVESDLNANYYYLEPVAAPAATAPIADAYDRQAPADSPQVPSFRRISSANLDRLDTVAVISMTRPKLLAWSAQGSRLAVVNADGQLGLYEYPDFAPALSDGAIPADLRATALAFSPDERYLALGTDDGRVYLHGFSNTGESESIFLNERRASPARALAWSNDGAQLAAASGALDSQVAGAENMLAIWDYDAGDDTAIAQPRIRYAFPYPLTDLAFSADDRWLAVSGESPDKKRAAIWIYDARDYELAWSKSLVYMGGRGFVTAPPRNSFGDFVYSHGDSLYHIEVETAKDRRFFHWAGAIMPVFAIRQQILPGAEVLVALTGSSLDGRGRLRVFNALNDASPELNWTLDASAIAFSPDGRLLALADPDNDRVLLLGAADR